MGREPGATGISRPCSEITPAAMPFPATQYAFTTNLAVNSPSIQRGSVTGTVRRACRTPLNYAAATDKLLYLYVASRERLCNLNCTLLFVTQKAATLACCRSHDFSFAFLNASSLKEISLHFYAVTS